MTDIIEISSDNEQEDRHLHQEQEHGLPTGLQNDAHDAGNTFDDTDEIGIEGIVPKILEMIPDVALDYLEGLVGEHLEKGDSKHCLENVLHALLEAPSYPKKIIAKCQKRIREPGDSGEGPSTKVARLETIDYASKDRPFKGSSVYIQLAINQLCLDFPFVPVSYIKQIIQKNNKLYAPTHLQLLRDQESDNPPYRPKSTRTKVSGKNPNSDSEYLLERAWLESHLQQLQPQSWTQALEPSNEAGDDIECGCCFSAYSFASNSSDLSDIELNFAHRRR